MQRGGRVAGTVRNLAHADELKKQFPDQLWIRELDLSDLANIANTFHAAVEHFGRVHAVVSNAAYSLLGAAEELQLDAIRHIVDTNLIGSIELARAAVAHMRPLGGGRLIQISSGAGQAAFPGLSLYCATKWGIEGFFESLAQEVADFGIQTTLVEPGTIRTDFGASGVLSPELDAYREGPVGMLRKMATDGYARARRSSKDGESDCGHIRCRRRAATPCAWTGCLRIYQGGTLQQAGTDRGLQEPHDVDRLRRRADRSSIR